jgi:CheY-like chemotaxis protein
MSCATAYSGSHEAYGADRSGLMVPCCFRRSTISIPSHELRVIAGTARFCARSCALACASVFVRPLVLRRLEVLMLSHPATLVVEDDPDNRTVLADYLSFRGFLVLPATTGEEALVLAALYRPDVILMNLHLGRGIDGIEATRRLRACPASATAVIIAVSAQCTVPLCRDCQTSVRVRRDTELSAALPAFADEHLRVHLEQHQHAAGLTERTPHALRFGHAMGAYPVGPRLRKRGRTKPARCRLWECVSALQAASREAGPTVRHAPGPIRADSLHTGTARPSYLFPRSRRSEYRARLHSGGRQAARLA